MVFFCLATEDQLKEIKKTSNKLIDNQKNTLHILDHQLSINKKNTNATLANLDKIIMLAEVLSNLNAVIQLHLKSPINMFQDTIIIINLLKAEIAADISVYRSALLNVELRKLYPEIIKLEILKESTNHWNKTPRFPTGIRIYKSTRFCTTSKVYVKTREHELH